MVEGLGRFAEHFAAFADQYVLIGGTPALWRWRTSASRFATKDFDIVLCVETLKPDFVAAFWEFVRRSVSDSGEGHGREAVLSLPEAGQWRLPVHAGTLFEDT